SLLLVAGGRLPAPYTPPTNAAPANPTPRESYARLFYSSRTALAGWAEHAVAGAPDEAEARPVLVDGRDLHVHEAELEGAGPHSVVRGVAAVPAGPARPQAPHRAGREDAPAQRRQPVGDLVGGTEERDDHV